MPPRATANPADVLPAVLAALGPEDRAWAERWCAAVGVPVAAMAHCPAVFRVLAAQAAGMLVRRFRAAGPGREGALREAARCLGVSPRTVESWLTRWPAEAIRGRARGAGPCKMQGLHGHPADSDAALKGTEVVR